MTELLCLNCGKPLTGRQTKYCGDRCGNLFRGRAFYQNHIDEVKEKREDFSLSQPIRSIIYRARHRAKKLGIPFNIEVNDIDIPAFCPVLGIPLVRHPNKGRGYHPDSPSLDRINANRGYIKGNVRVISARANLLKNNASVDELEKVLADLRKLNANPTPDLQDPDL